MPDRPQWMAWAECANVDPELFFPSRGGDTGETSATKEAKAVCARCMVRKACLNYALANGEKHGIWGGTSPRQRRRMLSVRSAA